MNQVETVPKICLTLSGNTLAEDMRHIQNSVKQIDMAELRADCLDPSEFAGIADFSRAVSIPLILTIRKACDGGKWQFPDRERVNLFRRFISNGRFSYVDFEYDFHVQPLSDLASRHGVRVIRSLHDFQKSIRCLKQKCSELRENEQEIPKLAFQVHSYAELQTVFHETLNFTDFPHIICAMGDIGKCSRILAARSHSFLTFCSPSEKIQSMRQIGHLSPEDLTETYHFRAINSKTSLFIAAGISENITKTVMKMNAAFLNDSVNAVVIPIHTDNVSNIMECVRQLDNAGLITDVHFSSEDMNTLSSLYDTVKTDGQIKSFFIAGSH